jgi:energy-converting hydrogenase Eha subunit E
MMLFSCYPVTVKWRTWLIDWPAAIVSWWWLLYTWYLTIVTMCAVTAVIVLLVLAAFGIRWGW